MGSGDRITVYRTGSFGVGVAVARFPFALTINVQVLCWGLSIGFWKGYDQ